MLCHLVFYKRIRTIWVWGNGNTGAFRPARSINKSIQVLCWALFYVEHHGEPPPASQQLNMAVQRPHMNDVLFRAVNDPYRIRGDNLRGSLIAWIFKKGEILDFYGLFQHRGFCVSPERYLDEKEELT